MLGSVLVLGQVMSQAKKKKEKKRKTHKKKKRTRYHDYEVTSECLARRQARHIYSRSKQGGAKKQLWFLGRRETHTFFAHDPANII
jgi:hypothetical protein